MFAYLRTYGDQKVIVVANMRKEGVKWTLPEGIVLKEDRILISNLGKIASEKGVVELRPFEAFACFVG